MQVCYYNFSLQTLSITSSASQENLDEQQQQAHVQAATRYEKMCDGEVIIISFLFRNTYLQPFLKQSHIDPIRGQSSNQIFNNMLRHHQVI